MYNLALKGISDKYDYEELIKVFIRPEDYRLFTDGEYPQDREILFFNEAGGDDKNLIKREIYMKLSKLTGKKPEWGILTGVRPVKIAAELLAAYGDKNAVKERLCDYYLLSGRKAELIIETAVYQERTTGTPRAGTAGIYIGIPFCPTRCLYCSFASNQVSDAEMLRYSEALLKELAFVGAGMRKKGLEAESVYIGGGTPTALNEDAFKRLLENVCTTFDMDRVREFTVEAGRPDTVNKEKLRAIRAAGAGRISINPQSMKDRTLELIGRSHSAGDIERAYLQAREEGIPIINCDVIAGLPEEDEADFIRTLEALINLGADNITVHTLAVKRASRLMDIDKDFHYKQAKTVTRQLAAGEELLRSSGYLPYYLYRQKHMAGALENIGWCKPGTECIYNIRIMEEKQTIVALGAGGISKVYYPEENRLERVPNVTNYEIYIERLEEMLKRKADNIFQED